MDVKQLRNFVAVADHKSFTRAAAVVNLSQPALSVSIRKLEHELDTVLFLRTPKTIIITDTGTDFLVHARAALREIEKAEEIVSASKFKRGQTVRIGVSSFFANIIAREIGTFCSENPNIKIEAEIMTQPTETVIDRITSGKWDFGLYLGHTKKLTSEQKQDVKFERCAELTTVVHARKQHPLANQSNVSLADLAEFPWVISTLTRGESITDMFTKAGLKPPNIIARVNTLDFIVSMVESRDLLTILPTYVVDKYHGATLVQLRNDDIQFHPAAIMVDSKEFALTAPARLLKHRVEKLMGSLDTTGTATNTTNGNPFLAGQAARNS